MRRGWREKDGGNYCRGRESEVKAELSGDTERERGNNYEPGRLTRCYMCVWRAIKWVMDKTKERASVPRHDLKCHPVSQSRFSLSILSVVCQLLLKLRLLMRLGKHHKWAVCLYKCHSYNLIYTCASKQIKCKTNC